MIDDVFDAILVRKSLRDSALIVMLEDALGGDGGGKEEAQTGAVSWKARARPSLSFVPAKRGFFFLTLIIISHGVRKEKYHLGASRRA